MRHQGFDICIDTYHKKCIFTAYISDIFSSLFAFPPKESRNTTHVFEFFGFSSLKPKTENTREEVGASF